MGKIMVGGRAKIFVDGVIVGIFDSCSYAVNVGAEPVHILGRFSPAEIAVTSYEAVTVNCSGFRVIGNGGHVLPKFPKLQDLIGLEGVRITITDRQDTTKDILTVVGCIPVNYSTGYNAKATSRIQVTYLGMSASDEEEFQSEGDATNLPS